MPRTTPYLAGGYYLWVAKSGEVLREARFGSHEEKTYLELKGDCFVPAGNGWTKKQLSCKNTLSYDERANLMHMLTAVNGGELPPTEEDADWHRILGVPLIVHVVNNAWHPKLEGSKDPDESITYWTTDIKGGATGWPVGVPLPAGVGVEDARSSASSTPTSSPPAQAVAGARTPATPPPNLPPSPAPPQEAPRPYPPGRSPSPPRPELAPTEPPPERGPRVQQQTRPPASPAWHEKRKRATALTVEALERMGWSKAPDADERENADAMRGFWIYFDQVPAVAALKRTREDGSATIVFSEDGGATEDALDLMVEALSRFLAGNDVRPPMPALAPKGGQA